MIELAQAAFGRVIGITGGMGAGKTFLADAACDALRKRGQPAHHLMADGVRFTILCRVEEAEHLRVRWRLSQAIGVPLQDDTTFDFETVSAAILADDRAQEAYRAIVCPAMVQEAQRFLNEAVGVVFLESALFFQDGFAPLLDGAAILATCPEPLRRSRARLRDAGFLSDEAIEARISRQPSPAQNLAEAHRLGVELVEVSLESVPSLIEAVQSIVGSVLAGRARTEPGTCRTSR